MHLGITVVKNLPADAGDARDTVLILGSGRSPGVGNGNPFQYVLAWEISGTEKTGGPQFTGLQRAGHS